MDERDWGRALLLDAVGARLEGVARAFHQHRGQVDESRGALQLSFAGGRILHLTTAINGESVWVRPGPWTDPLADPDEGIDEAWAREHGRGVLVDVSSRAGYAQAAGERLDGVRWLANGHGSVAGVEMRFGPALLTFVSWGDDEHVITGGASAIPAEWGMTPVPSPSPEIARR